ncbi:MAG: HEPN domain-containing protein [Bacillota bacterium]|nr:HEPN domain-containing protein [Bacillota bacterium]
MDFMHLDLEDRKTDTKDKKVPEIIIYEIKDIQSHFEENKKLVLDQFPIADALEAKGNLAGAETIWRSQIVLLASAYDYFMHEIVWFGLFQMYKENWGKTDKYKKLTISLSQLDEILKNPEDDNWFKEYITPLFAKDTMMDYEALKDNLKLIGLEIREVADCAFFQQGCKVKTIDQLKDKLNSLYFRRNRIAHQSNRSHENAETKDISKSEVEQFVLNIDKIVEAILDVMSKH